MKEFVKPTTKKNADAVMAGAKMFDFFDTRKFSVSLLDRFTYAVYENMELQKHPISRVTFEITCVDDTPALISGMTAVGFRRIRT